MMRPKPPTRRQTTLFLVLFLAYAVLAAFFLWPVLITGAVVSTITAWWFLLTYMLTTRWEQHVTGWNMVLMSGSMTGLLTLTLLSPLAPQLVGYFGAFLYAGFTLSCVWLVRTLRRVQREGRNPLLDRTVDPEAATVDADGGILPGTK